jgi:outer membrane immunogenic protein
MNRDFGGIKMNKLFLGSVALAAAMIAGPAMAADMPVKAKAPPPVVVYDWSGAYVGFNIGGTWYDVERVYPNLLGASITSSGDDGIYGFHAGAQGQWGNWVLGIEAAYSACFHECQSSAVIIPLPAPLGPGLEAHNKITNLFTVGPRLGYAWDRWMIYGTGGYATASVKGQYLLGGVEVAATRPFSGQSWNHGWFAGGGFEYMAHKGALVDVILGVEYQHVDLRSERAFNDTVFVGAPFSFDQDAVLDIVRARLTIKTQGWGWTGPWK